MGLYTLRNDTLWVRLRTNLCVINPVGSGVSQSYHSTLQIQGRGCTRYETILCVPLSVLVAVKKGRLFVTFLTMSPATQAIAVTKTGCKTLTVTVTGTSLLPPGALRCRGAEACVPLRPPELCRRQPCAPGRFNHAGWVCGRVVRQN